ncbi:hypothetical protein E3N88_21031 [Mikania micrantha]|uniref:Uncharacterized protein n=1 Tax=Mikania micrantha TaxID=192012 RepID=A0A5N6NLH7_9ASTR|nr:hypothetical protein E3N88_21031 [Mikania micrantha]
MASRGSKGGLQVEMTGMEGLELEKCRVGWLEMIVSWFYKIFACQPPRVPPWGFRRCSAYRYGFREFKLPAHSSHTAMDLSRVLSIPPIGPISMNFENWVSGRKNRGDVKKTKGEVNFDFFALFSD